MQSGDGHVVPSGIYVDKTDVCVQYCLLCVYVHAFMFSKFGTVVKPQ